jgi:hypothetical protein
MAFRFTNCTSSYDLPDDVFAPGEKRPVRTKKTKTKKARAAGSAQGGSFPSPSTNGNTPISTPASSKKRNLDQEVGPTSPGACVKQWHFVSHGIPAGEGTLVTRKAVASLPFLSKPAFQILYMLTAGHRVSKLMVLNAASHRPRCYLPRLLDKT